MRLLDWNIEWMNNWFVGGGAVAFRQNHPSTGIVSVDDLCKRVAGVVKNINPDVLTVQEGPSDIREMELFVRTYLLDAQGNDLFDIFGGIDGGSQKVYILVKKGGKFSNPVLAEDQSTLKLQNPWESDVDGDLNLEGYEFTRLPLVVDGKVGNKDFRIITLHTKSKYVHNGENLWKNADTKMQFIIAAMKNRRRISAEAMRMRGYLDDLLEQDAESRVIVTGDLNDGPGIDYFESHYLTHNVTDIILGSTYYPDLILKHAFLGAIPSDSCYTAIFDDFIDEIQGRRLLLDHILVSPVLSNKIKDSVIAHQEYDAATDNNATGRQKYVSDHRPVYIDL